MKILTQLINKIRQLCGKNKEFMPHDDSIKLMTIETISNELIQRFDEGIILYIEPTNRQTGSLKVHAKIDDPSELKRLLPEVLQNIIDAC